MSKAFDMVDHGHLFDLLILRRLSYPDVRFLIQWNSHQRLQIRWKGTLSPTFSVANGMRQGGILSPILFTVYIDEILPWLANIEVEGHVCRLPLLCGRPCSTSSICLCTQKNVESLFSDFGMERNLMFNAGKTQLICFRRQRSIVVDDCIEFCGQELKFSDSVCHLGHMLFM